MKSFVSPDAAIEALAARLGLVEPETIAVAAGRVLAEGLLADRDSPAADVSAMDGYAVRMSDLSHRGPLRVAGEVQPGQPPPEMPDNAVLRVFTGAVVPPGAQAVVKREDTQEQADAVLWSDAARSLAPGANIRRRGENGRCGSEVIPAGAQLNAASVATAINFGAARVTARRQVRTAVIVTGNELLGAEDAPQPWQLRDSNGPTVAALISARPWLHLQHQTRCGDDAQALKEVLSELLRQSDAVILTGGVSKGDYDHVPGVIAQVGGEIIFHRLPIRPGKPVLGAVTERGQLILGLPGNPVSAACCMLRIAIPLLRKLGGHRNWRSRPLSVRLEDSGTTILPLHWMRLVRLAESLTADPTVQVQLVPSQGSGDLVALGTSDGFIEQPPDTSGPGPWPFYRW